MRRASPVRTAGAIVLALAIVGATGGLLFLDIARPVSAAPPATPQVYAVSAGTVTLVCPGGLKSVTDTGAGSDIAYDPAFDPAVTVATSTLEAVAPAVAGTAPDTGITAADGAAVDAVIAGGGAAAVVSLDSPDQPTIITAAPVEDLRATLAGAVVIESDAGDLRGLAGAACQMPAATQTILGGTTEMGASARLVLVNPGKSPVSVNIALWGASGPIETVGTTGIPVPAGAQRAVLLEGVVSDARRLGVSIETIGGSVAAFLQDTRISGLTPLGVDFAVPSAPAATTQVVPDIRIADDGTSDDPASLRLFVPGQAEATIRLSIRGADGEVTLPGFTDQVLPAQTVTDISLAGLQPGRYAIAIESDQPVISAGMIVGARDQEDSPADRAWMPGIVPGESGVLAMPVVDKTSVVVSSEQGATVRLTPLLSSGAAGTPVDVEVGALSTTALRAITLGSDAVGFAYEVTAGGPVTVVTEVAVASTGGELISVVTPVLTEVSAQRMGVREQPRLGLE